VSIVQWLDGWRRDSRCLADTQSHTHSQRRRPTTDRVHGQPSRRVAVYQRLLFLLRRVLWRTCLSLSVCLSANIISGTSCRIFANFFVAVANDSGSVTHGRRCDTLQRTYTSGFLDGVMFAGTGDTNTGQLNRRQHGLTPRCQTDPPGGGTRPGAESDQSCPWVHFV